MAQARCPSMTALNLVSLPTTELSLEALKPLTNVRILSVASCLDDLEYRDLGSLDVVGTCISNRYPTFAWNYDGSGKMRKSATNIDQLYARVPTAKRGSCQ